MRMRRRSHIFSRSAVVFWALCLVALAFRLAAMTERSLWADEFFSLAIATGHSVEHPAERANASLGDYVEPKTPVPASELKRYIDHDRPPAGMRRVWRATFLSDTSPPLYYLLLNVWTRIWGTTDAALRSLSLVASLAAMPLIARIARRLGGRRAVPLSLVLYALAPASVYYSTEGRMYSLLWLIAAAQALASLRLRQRRGKRWLEWIAWGALGSAGLLTHYFYAFPLSAFVLWLAVQRRRVPPARLALALGFCLALVSAWYVEIPTSMSQWRVTKGWLDGLPDSRRMLRAPLDLIASLVSARGKWDRRAAWPNAFLLAVFALLGVSLFASRFRRALIFGGLWLGSACLGPIVFDLLQNSHTALIPRYALAGLPAAMILAGVALARLPRVATVPILALIIALWTPALGTISGSSFRGSEPFRQVTEELDSRVGAEDLIVIQSIPASAAGLARHLRGSALVLPWTERLREGDAICQLEDAVRGHAKVALVRVQRGFGPKRAIAWLEQNSLTREHWVPSRGVSEIVFFQFQPDRAPACRDSSGRGSPGESNTRQISD
jgi:hypothetical protein